MSEDAAVKKKTVAKQRYLKAKKDRRKKRKGVKLENRSNGQQETVEVIEEDESDDGATVEEMDDEDVAHGEPQPIVEKSSEPHPTPVEPKSKAKKEKRPKKRQKTSPPLLPTKTDDDGMDVDVDVDVSTTINHGVEDDTNPLPSFPLPTAPNPPSRAQLAAQGLDSSLLTATIIDPALTVTVNDQMLSEKMKLRLKEIGIDKLFAVQTALLPFLLDPRCMQLYLPYDPPCDAAISAPTGSGKTLAYVIPIVEILAQRRLTMLRALIVLPTRDLVTQVRETFESVAKGRGLKIGVTTGQHSFAHEQNAIVDDMTTHLRGGSSKIDILVTTPGRLIDHLDGTPNFTLQHLRFLVIDEADRLLASSFQNWLQRVLLGLSAPTLPPPPSANSFEWYPPIDFPKPDLPAPTHLPAMPLTEFDILPESNPQSSCQKLLFSATLTSDPGQLKKLALRDVKYFIVKGSNVEGAPEENDAGESFEMPASLTERFIVTTTALKPLTLFHIVHTHEIRNALIFTKSTESTGRLLKLWESFERRRLSGDVAEAGKVVAKAYSSDLAPHLRKSVLNDFRKADVSILVCSDLISRGIDISTINHVISYDAPVDLRKYVHRAGRTARAGRDGTAWTLVEEQEARHFKGLMRDAGRMEKVGRLKIKEEDMNAFKLIYEDALKELRG